MSSEEPEPQMKADEPAPARDADALLVQGVKLMKEGTKESIEEAVTLCGQALECATTNVDGRAAAAQPLSAPCPRRGSAPRHCLGSIARASLSRDVQHHEVPGWRGRRRVRQVSRPPRRRRHRAAAPPRRRRRAGAQRLPVTRYYFAYGDALLKAVESMGEIVGGGVPAEKEDLAEDEDGEPEGSAGLEEDIELAWCAPWRRPARVPCSLRTCSPPTRARRVRARASDSHSVRRDMLEVARMGLLKQVDSEGSVAAQKALGDVYTRLGDLSQLNDQFDQAKSDYASALGWRASLSS